MKFFKQEKQIYKYLFDSSKGTEQYLLRRLFQKEDSRDALLYCWPQYSEILNRGITLNLLYQDLIEKKHHLLFTIYYQLKRTRTANTVKMRSN